MIFGFYAWRLYDVEGAERSLLRASVGVAVDGVRHARRRDAADAAGVSEPRRSPSSFKDANCRNPIVAAAGFHEPSLVFLIGTRTRLVDGSSAAEILRGGDCRFAIIESRQERAFAQRAEQIGLRYRLAGGSKTRSTSMAGASISFAIYRTEPGL